MMDRVVKLCGADIELGNFVLGFKRRGHTCAEASRALLREIDGFSGRRWSASYGSDPVSDVAGDASHTATRYVDGHGYREPTGHRRGIQSGYASAGSYDPQDWGRKFLPTNGGCAYIDLDHLELCVPETLSAEDHVACWHAQLRLAQDALAAANVAAADGLRIQGLVCNSDGLGNSFGSHLNFLITRQAWNDLFQRRPHYLGHLAAYQVSSIVFTGQGKVGSENGMPPADFQLSQRADMIETLVGHQTTYRRPLLNTRDEPLCGPHGLSGDHHEGERALRESLARLHVIFFDATLCQAGSLLKVGVMQIILAMLEAREIDPALALDDPLDALWSWSHDPDLRTTAAMASGGRATAVELQRRFAADARRFVEKGDCDRFVPGAEDILELWEDTLDRLEDRDFDTLSRRLDWVLKRSILERVMDGRPDLDWSSPEMKHLDLMYGSLDPEEGLFWSYARSGTLEQVVSAERIEHFRYNPPEDTRAWGRAMWLRYAGRHRTTCVDWDRVEVKVPRVGHRYPRATRIDLSDPLGSTRADLGSVFEDAEGAGLAELVDRLEAHDRRIEERPVEARPAPEGLAPLPRLIPANTNHGSTRNGHA